ncbi:sigma-54 dependent transcriptional regulator [bacterium]|nr:sigma-54 dependent transcriptional regulator [bacterium]MBU1652526.1 sigma-54 dependent transcriptional regulator [bacterium]
MSETRPRILVVDDDVSQADSLVILLRREGYDAAGVYTISQAISHLQANNVNLVLSDLRLEDHDGIWLTEQIKRNFPEVVVVIITAYGTIESAVQAVKGGAFDYLLKPIQLNQLRLVLERAVQWCQMHRKVRELENRLQEHQERQTLLGNSTALQRVHQMVSRVAESDASVLICGESGTGKELVAEMIHRKSLRRDHPLVIVNCGALPETLQESELFGHSKGAFTGAMQDKKGLLTEADGGTLFLDEVGELSPQAQVKLLRFLENGECRRVGDTQTQNLDVRVLAATNRDLQQLIDDKQFRSDLFYRLNVISVTVPPLRDIKEDIPVIAHSFLEDFAARMEKKPPRLSEECLHIFSDHNWPGNVRELRNLIERAVVVDQDGVITLADLPEHLRTHGSNFIEEGLEKQLPLKEIERRYILSTLTECGGSRKRTGEILGITKATLWRKLNSYRDEARDTALRGQV